MSWAMSKMATAMLSGLMPRLKSLPPMSTTTNVGRKTSSVATRALAAPSGVTDAPRAPTRWKALTLSLIDNRWAISDGGASRRPAWLRWSLSRETKECPISAPQQAITQ